MTHAILGLRLDQGNHIDDYLGLDCTQFREEKRNLCRLLQFAVYIYIASFVVVMLVTGANLQRNFSDTNRSLIGRPFDRFN